jgi:hypothetical protein
MREVEIDISGKKTQGVFDVSNPASLFAYVITCRAMQFQRERCPIFAGVTKRLYWEVS